MNGEGRENSISGLRLIVRDFLVYLEFFSGNERAFRYEKAPGDRPLGTPVKEKVLPLYF